MTRPIPRRPTLAALLLGATLAGLGPATADPSPQAEPGAARWKTWVIRSADALRLPAPPNEAASVAELARLRELAAGRDAETQARIVWWNGVAPSYRWNQIAVDEAIRAGQSANVAARSLAVLHTALADAMIATWDSKLAHGRPRPGMADPTFRTAVPTPASASWPDEHAVAGTVASTILTELYPERTAIFAQAAEEAARLRLVAGVAYPSDVEAGTALGRAVAAAALERAAADRSKLPWTGSVPNEPGLWNGTNPVLPQAATWVPWVLASPDEFRPPPPPAFDSPERAAELAAVRDFKRTPKTSSDALFWEVAVGGLRNFQYWNSHAARLLLESGEATSAPRAARAFALFQAAFYDAGIACWDAKYAYWTIRPAQLDPELKTVFPMPNHPSYPAAHACYSSTAAAMLSHLFPRDAAALKALAQDSGNSRVWAGIHYPGDVAAGRKLAEQVAARVVERARSDPD